MNGSTWRIALGLVLAPLVLVIAWSVPYIEHSAFHTWVVINTVTAYIFFSVLACACHFILKSLHLSKSWHYVFVMFAVSFVGTLGLSVWGFIGYSSYTYEHTDIVKNGWLTLAGLVLQTKWALESALIYSASFFLFWLVAVPKTDQSSP